MQELPDTGNAYLRIGDGQKEETIGISDRQVWNYKYTGLLN